MCEGEGEGRCQHHKDTHTHTRTHTTHARAHTHMRPSKNSSALHSKAQQTLWLARLVHVHNSLLRQRPRCTVCCQAYASKRMCAHAQVKEAHLLRDLALRQPLHCVSHGTAPAMALRQPWHCAWHFVSQGCLALRQPWLPGTAWHCVSHVRPSQMEQGPKHSQACPPEQRAVHAHARLTRPSTRKPACQSSEPCTHKQDSIGPSTCKPACQSMKPCTHKQDSTGPRRPGAQAPPPRTHQVPGDTASATLVLGENDAAPHARRLCVWRLQGQHASGNLREGLRA